MPHPLLQFLSDHSWVVLRPSSIAGVGVFALRDIPQGCRDMFSPPGAPDEYVAVPRADVEALPAHARHLIENFCLYDAEWYWVPRDGFRNLDLSHFLNHSNTPNVASIEEGLWFETLRDIAAGEELTVDYGALVDDEEDE